jgi:hypothetical protein
MIDLSPYVRFLDEEAVKYFKLANEEKNIADKEYYKGKAVGLQTAVYALKAAIVEIGGKKIILICGLKDSDHD